MEDEKVGNWEGEKKGKFDGKKVGSRKQKVRGWEGGKVRSHWNGSQRSDNGSRKVDDKVSDVSLAVGLKSGRFNRRRNYARQMSNID